MVRICSVNDVPLYEGRAVRVGGRSLAVFHSAAGFRVLDNTCPHLGGPLADGIVTEATVACPLHDRRFELASGDAVSHDCGGVGAHPVEVRGDDVFVSLRQPASRPCGARGVNASEGSASDGVHRITSDTRGRGSSAAPRSRSG
jgi:nitrite reductase (NADH) small subunit